MPQRKGLVAPQNRFLDTIATRFHGTHSNFVLGNAQVRDYPIVYCSDGLIELTGFNRSQIMTRCCSCSFLWGEMTVSEKRQMITNALDKKQELQIEVYFQKRSGESFLCLMDIVPIKNDKSQVVLFLVSHKDITAERSNPRVSGTIPRISRFPISGVTNKHSIVRSTLTSPPSFLSAGLATTITAAALGTTAFRSNKLLDYLHMNKSNLSDFGPLLTSSSGHGYPKSSILVHQRRRTAPATTMRKTSRDSSDEHIMNKITRHRNSLEMNYTLPNNKTSNSLLPTDLDDSSTDSSYDSNKKDDDDQSTTGKYERRRSRAVLFHLSGRFDQNAKRKTNLKQFQTLPEYKVQDVQASRLIVLHFSLFKIVWDWVILLCTFYIAIMVPYNAAFKLDDDDKDLLVCDIITEVLLIVDVVLNFLTTFVSKSGQVVYHLRQIAIHYLRGWFFLDLLAAIPFDTIFALHDGLRSGVGGWIPLLKLSRLLRLARIFQKIERYSQYSTVILGLLICMFFLVAHWFACGWYWLGRVEVVLPNTQNYSWLSELGRRMQTAVFSNDSNRLSGRAIYVSSLYFTTTSLTSVGFGNVSPNTVNEKIFSIITMLIGALMHAAVFGNVTTLIQRMYARRSAYQIKNQDLKDFTRAHHIPKPLRQRMLEFFQAMWAINRGIDKDAIMQCFPENVRGDIALHLNREILSLPLFKSASPGCRKCLAQTIHTRFATPGEYLINQGDVLRDIFFVCTGSLEILDSQGTVVGLLGKCDIFGSDIDDYPSLGFSAYDVKSLTYCELQTITLDPPFQQILEQYPHFKREFAESLHEELSFNIREGFDASASFNELPAVTAYGGRINRQEGQVHQNSGDESDSNGGKELHKFATLKIENEMLGNPLSNLSSCEGVPILNYTDERKNDVKPDKTTAFTESTEIHPDLSDFTKQVDDKRTFTTSSDTVTVTDRDEPEEGQPSTWPLYRATMEQSKSCPDFFQHSLEHKNPTKIHSTKLFSNHPSNSGCNFDFSGREMNSPNSLMSPVSGFPVFHFPVQMTKYFSEVHREVMQLRKEMHELSKQVERLIEQFKDEMHLHRSGNSLSRKPSAASWSDMKTGSMNSIYKRNNPANHKVNTEEISGKQDIQQTTDYAHSPKHNTERVVKFQLPERTSHSKRATKIGSVGSRSGCLRNHGHSEFGKTQSCDAELATLLGNSENDSQTPNAIKIDPFFK